MNANGCVDAFQRSIDLVLFLLARKLVDLPKRYPKFDHVVNIIEEKTRLTIEHHLLGLGCFLAFMLFSGFGANIFCHLVAFCYPSYTTLQNLEEKNSAESKFWLVYWGKRN